MNIEVLAVALLSAMATSLVGVFLVLRRLSMLTDAISHTILLGIVLAFMVVADLTSPFLLVAATLMGVLTVFMIEALMQTRRIKEDAAIGVVFTFLFSIAIIIVTTQFRNVHLDINMVLLGNLEFVVFDRLRLFGADLGPTSLWVMGIVLALNLGLLSVFYKEIKLSSFDPALASVLGFSAVLMHYGLMAMVSLTAVAAFNAVGAILVIALMIGPPITALLFTKTLFHTIVLTLCIAAFNSVVGYALAWGFDITISGTIATVTMASFFAAMLFSPKRGILFEAFRMRTRREHVALAGLLVHVENHADSEDAAVELNVKTVHEHMNWSRAFCEKILHRAKSRDYIRVEKGIMQLTETGHAFYRTVLGDSRGTVQ